MLKNSILFFILLLVLSGCQTGKGRLDIDLSAVRINPVVIHRYDLDLFRNDGKDLQSHLESIRKDYPFFLDTDLSDIAKLREMQGYLENQRNREFYRVVSKTYTDLSEIERQLTLAFRHIKFYYPAFNPPRVYSYISGGDYDYPVQYADSVLLIGLDNYLGTGYKPYIADGLPQYRIARTIREEIVPAAVEVILNQLEPQQVPGNNLLEQIVQAGKRIYLLEAMIPGMEDRFKIRYSEQQINWITRNEKHVWAAMITHQMLYSADGKLIRSFLSDGPFTAEFSKESPPRLGEWIGWKIVSGYMQQNPDVTLKELIRDMDAQKILSNSGYKPEL
jgi:hypothetical protein